MTRDAAAVARISRIARMLAERADQLARALLPGGHREGHEWRAGSVAGEPGDSLGVHLTGSKSGVWCDFAAGIGGDALDLVRAVFNYDMPRALDWSCRWLGIEPGAAELPQRPKPSTKKAPEPSLDFWRSPWSKAAPITGTPAAAYLAGRELRFDDPHGDVLRFAERHARRSPAGDIEHHPALLALLRDVNTGEPCGIINVYLHADGADRLRDSRGKTSWGRARGAAAMLDPFEDVALGLTVAEGVETAIALHMAEQRPVWALGGAGNLGNFPVLAGVEALTIAADSDEPGRKAAEAVAQRWRDTGREAVIVAPPVAGTDWADRRVA